MKVKTIPTQFRLTEMERKILEELGGGNRAEGLKHLIAKESRNILEENNVSLEIIELLKTPHFIDLIKIIDKKLIKR